MPISEYLRRLREKVGHDLLALSSAAVALYDNQRRILLGRHADRNIWVLPGGLVEPAELPADAAVREAWEETGLIVELTGILGVFGGGDLVVHYKNGDVASYVATIFCGRITGGQLAADGEELLEVRFVSRAELESLPHPKWMDGAMAALFEQHQEPQFQPPTWSPPQMGKMGPDG